MPDPIPPPPPPPPTLEQVELDKTGLDLARAAAATPWYASGLIGIALIIGPPLFFIDGHLAGQGLSIWSDALNFFYPFFGVPCLFLPWLAFFFLHRSRATYLRTAIATRRAWRLTAPVTAATPKAVVVAGLTLRTLHRVTIPRWVDGSACEVLYADARIGNPNARITDGTVISITGPGGGLLYPRMGRLPSLLRMPAIIASAFIALGFTATCTGQAQGYDDAGTRLREINAAIPCTSANKPGDACRRWVDGTVEWTGSSSVQAASGSVCSVKLRWQGAEQDGDIRTSIGDCSQQLATPTPLPAKIALVRNYATEVYIGQTLYQTDRWPQVDWPVQPLASFFRVAAFLWLAWPVTQAALALLFWLRPRSRAAARTPSPPAPALGSRA